MKPFQLNYLNSYYLNVISWTYLNALRYIILIDYTLYKIEFNYAWRTVFDTLKNKFVECKVLCWLHISVATTIMAAPEVRFSDSGAYIRRNFPSYFLSRAACGRRDAAAK